VIPAGGDHLDGESVGSPEDAENRENCVRNDLLKRLRGVCKDLPAEEFQELVSEMTRVQLRSERLRG